METTRVRIFDVEYALKGDNPELITKLANQVDQSMRDLNKGLASQSPLSLAVLTALNLAESLEIANAKATEPDLFFENELERMITFADQSIKRNNV